MNVFITGAGRGLGLALATEHADAGDVVFAAARAASPALTDLARRYDKVRVVSLDVTDDDALAAAARDVAAVVDHLDVVINNAAVNKKGAGLGSYDRRAMLEHFAVNSVAPVLVAQAFWPLLQRSSRGRLVNISTQVGSFTWNTSGSSPLYAASKAALNMYTRALAREAKGVIAIAVHPGWVQTDMGGKSAPLTPSESARALRALIERLQPSDNGQFFNVDGKHHPW